MAPSTESLISDLILCVNGVPGRSDKITLLMDGLTKFSPEERTIFEEFLNYVFRVDYSYGVTFDTAWKFKEESPQAHIGLEQLFNLFDDLRHRKLSGNAAINQVQLTLENAESPATFHIGKMILNRTLDCGMDKKTIMKLFPSVLPFTPAMMKCEPADEKSLKKAKYPGMLQLKIDAMRVNADTNGEGVVDFWTFNGNQFSVMSDDLNEEIEMLRAKLAPKYGQHQFFDGEMQIYSLGKPLPRKKSNAQANRILKDTAPIDVHENTHIVLWDVLRAEDVVGKVSVLSNEERFADLKAAMESLDLKYLHLVEHCEGTSEEQVLEQVIQWIERGEEGGIFKNSASPWEGKRSDQCIKFKAKREADVRITGWNLGDPDGKYRGLIGSLIAETDDGGFLFNISGICDDDRWQWSADVLDIPTYRKYRDKEGVEHLKEYLPSPEGEKTIIGKITSIFFNEVIENEKRPDKLSVFLPRIAEVRSDKDECDTTEVVKAAKGIKKREAA